MAGLNRAAGELRAIKRSANTLVLLESPDGYIAGLPPYEGRAA